MIGKYSTAAGGDDLRGILSRERIMRLWERSSDGEGICERRARADRYVETEVGDY